MKLIEFNKLFHQFWLVLISQGRSDARKVLRCARGRLHQLRDLCGNYLLEDVNSWRPGDRPSGYDSLWPEVG
jgi:hypothetical protein